MESLYEKYNLKPVINASGKMTILGVSKYVQEAIEAQKFAGEHFFEMSKLQINVGKYLAELIGVEDAQIVSSASSGIAQSVAALIGKGSQYHVEHPYSERFNDREIVIPKGHNVNFGASVGTMIELGGGKVVEAGHANGCSLEDISEACTNNTVAILYVKSHHSVQKSMLTVSEAATVANEHNLPLIVDAAAEEDLKIYYEQGADLVIYSGAKALEGPSSGIVLGKSKYIEWLRLQSLGMGRAMKIGKENILGLAAAIERFIQSGLETGESMRKRLEPFVKNLNKIPLLQAKVIQDSAGRDIYRAEVTVESNPKISAEEIVNEMQNGSPAIYTRNYQVNNGIIEFDIRSVNAEEITTIEKRLNTILS